MQRKAVLYLRVSTLDQTTANQERELREVADRMGVEVVKTYRDHGVSGAKGRDKRPQFDALCRECGADEAILLPHGGEDEIRMALRHEAVRDLA